MLPPFYIFLAEHLKIGSAGTFVIGPAMWQPTIGKSISSLDLFQTIQHFLGSLSAIQIIQGTGATLWAITLTILIFIDANGLGHWILGRSGLQVNAYEKLLFGTGLGLGVLGILGYGLAAAGLADRYILAGILFCILTWIFISKIKLALWSGFRSLELSFYEARSEIPKFIPLAVAITLLLGFVLALLPPTLGFDGLSYHLPLPERLLADRKVLPYNIFPFWYPSLIEGDFTIALGLGSERAAQLIHFSFLLLLLALIWEWSRTLFGPKVAWWSLAILVSMPSLPWLASWAYSDIALTFFCLACLYATWKWGITKSKGWLSLAGVFAGLAMSIKYTSFILPLACIFMILLWEKGISGRIVSLLRFSIPALLTALPWYLRTWLVMGNPIYPYFFEGLYWDSFRSQWNANYGTGIGLDIREIVLIPFNIMLGYKDKNYFDGHIGPFMIIFAPFAIWAIWKKRYASHAVRNALFIISVFAGMTCAFWIFGIMQTFQLWQTRYLWPGLVPFAIPLALAITLLPRLDLPRFRASLLAKLLSGVVIATILLDNSLGLIARKPFLYIFGMESRESYFKRTQSYAYAIDLVDSTPADSFVYFLFEARSYNMPRKVQPDIIDDNLAHDFYLYESADAVLEHWQQQGYTHILIRTAVVRQNQDLLNQMTELLTLVRDNRGYQLYSIPKLIQ